jgi:hypothetical protein
MEDLKKVLGTYSRAFLASVVTLAISGVTDPKALLAAGLASVLPPLLRWIDPKDKEYGKK